MEQLQKLIDHCKGAVHLTINDHRSCYESVLDHIKNCMQDDMTGEIPPTVLDKMVETDTVIQLQFYPRTAIGFFVVFHYDIAAAIQKGIEIIEREVNIA